MTSEPLFLSLALVLEIHKEAIEVYGGARGARDIGLLESAIAQPRATFGGRYLHESLSSMAAAYCFHLVMNHPFIDGNKRVGAMAAFVFLDMNGAKFDASQEEYLDLVLALAAGNRTKDDVIEFFRRHVRE